MIYLLSFIIGSSSDGQKDTQTDNRTERQDIGRIEGSKYTPSASVFCWLSLVLQCIIFHESLSRQVIKGQRALLNKAFR